MVVLAAWSETRCGIFMVILEGDNGIPLNYRSESLKRASTDLKRNYKLRRYKFRLYPPLRAFIREIRYVIFRHLA